MKVKYKELHNVRVCVIDPYPLLTNAIRDTVDFCDKNNISFYTSGRGSEAVQKLFYHYCICYLSQAYESCRSKYPKIAAFYPYKDRHHKVVNHFIDTFNFAKVLKSLPFPHCMVSTKNDKDIEIAVVNTLEKDRTNYNKMVKFASIHKLNDILDMYKKKKSFTGDIIEEPKKITPELPEDNINFEDTDK